jgi:aminoglycoside phosphotransferase (APT) family kinase protein
MEGLRGDLVLSSMSTDVSLLHRPPPAALMWTAAAVGPGSRVVSVRRLAGLSSAVHALVVQNSRQVPHEFVLRRYVRREWLRREPDLAEREAQVLGILQSTAVTAPRLIACDPRGDHCDVPAVLMTRVAGRPRWRGADVAVFASRLAEALVRVHSVLLPSDTVTMLRPYRPHNQHLLLSVPKWAAVPSIWEWALELYSGPARGGTCTALLHRDYHPGNVLWRGDVVSGIVDWANASVGCVNADLGHCRMVLALSSGQESAERFLRAYFSASGNRGGDYHPYWDVVAAIGVLPDIMLTGAQAARLDRFVSSAIGRLG